MIWGELKVGDVIVNTDNMDGFPVVALVLKRVTDTVTWLDLMKGKVHESTRDPHMLVERYMLLSEAGT